jgi:hypothetical protein
MLRKGTENKYEAPFSGPHKILKVNTNGTVRLRVGSVTDMVNIRRIEPYKEVSDSIHGGECNITSLQWGLLQEGLLLNPAGWLDRRDCW